MGILYYLMQKYMNTLTNGDALPNAWVFVGLVAAFVVLSFFTHLEQYKTTYGLVYREIKDTPTAEGSDTFKPDGHDITFENVSFAYDDHDVLNGVSFTAGRARSRRLSVPPARARAPARALPRGSGTSTKGRSGSAAWISRPSIRRSCSPIIPWCFRTSCCSTTP